jgi:hypothetical protein
MQCPDCGYNADESAVFCPQCRFQFRDIIEEPDQAADSITGLPERGVISDETVLEKTIPDKRKTGFSDRELLQLEVQLLQPAVLVVLIIALVTYTILSAIPFVPVTIAGLNFSIIGILCLACGFIFGIVFFFIARRSLVHFRYQ